MLFSLHVAECINILIYRELRTSCEIVAVVITENGPTNRLEELKVSCSNTCLFAACYLPQVCSIIANQRKLYEVETIPSATYHMIL